MKVPGNESSLVRKFQLPNLVSTSFWVTGQLVTDQLAGLGPGRYMTPFSREGEYVWRVNGAGVTVGGVSDNGSSLVSDFHLYAKFYPCHLFSP